MRWEFWISAIDPLNPDGVYIYQLDVAVINGSLPTPSTPVIPAVLGEIINLGEYLDKGKASKLIGKSFGGTGG